MPLNRCESDGSPGWKWGDAPSAKCYTYTAGNEESEKAARKKAMAQAAAMGEFPGTGVMETRGEPDGQASPLAPIEFRQSSVSDVKFAQRIVDLIVVPYEEPGIIEFRGELWTESFARGAFDGIEKRPNRVRANRDHDDHRIIGKALKFWPSREEGLVAEVRVSQTPLGDETLALADDGILSASVGFAARGRDQVFDRKNSTRYIKKAFVDHIAFVPVPTYEGAGVLAVRAGVPPANAAELPKLETPNLDELRVWYQARH